MNDSVLIEVRDLAAGYTKPVVENVNFELKQSEITALMGPNGAGKSTILRAILGLAKIFSGRIRVLNYEAPSDASKIRRVIGYVPQKEYVSPRVPLKAIDIVLSGLLLRRGPLSLATRRDMQIIKETLNTVGLPREAWFKRFSELSGGQQQKVLLARALVAKPKILLLDEPFSAIDIKSVREIMEFLDILRRQGIGTILVVHDINNIIDYIDKIILVNKKMVAFGEPTEVLEPENLKEAYGAEVELIQYKDKCLALIGDKHA